MTHTTHNARHGYSFFSVSQTTPATYPTTGWKGSKYTTIFRTIGGYAQIWAEVNGQYIPRTILRKKE